MLDLRKYFNSRCYRAIGLFYADPCQFPVWKRCLRPLYRLAEDGVIRFAMLLKVSPNLLWSRHLSNYTYLAGRLPDDDSRQLLEKIAAMRILGGRFVRFEENEAVFSRIERMLGVKRYYGGGTEMVVDMSAVFGLSETLSAYAEPFTIATLACGQYQHPFATPLPGDVCVDFGAYEGETTLFLAEKVGESGKVYAVEFVPDQLRLLHDNLNANPEQQNRVIVLAHPFWDESGKETFVTGRDGSAKVSFMRQSDENMTFRTITLDDAVAQYRIDKIDFMKFDVEGAELPILRGAVKTLKSFRPKLAVSLYHADSDFDTIPRFLDSLQCGYEFRLGHHSTGKAETVLYASATQSGNKA